MHFVPAVMFSLGLTIAGAQFAYAGPATDEVKAKQTALYDLLAKPGTEKKVAATFDEVLDYDTIAQGSLGSEWANRSDAEKAQFSDLLKQLVRRSYERNIKKTLNYNIEYTAEAPKGSQIVVSTKAVSKTDKRADPVEIDYTLAQKDGKWRIQDIKTDGVSLVSSYRSQFTKIIKKDGFPVLIQKMKDKIAKGDV
ncbi:MAG TPA: ABC transporter substrate-binding protein [Polyangium sp.]|jgi:phospholipid transport system substrate-binding protein|nr:ABC transporter substrate-binding protein [Polyangium sp.]